MSQLVLRSLVCLCVLSSAYCIVFNLIFVGKVETYVPFTIPINMNCNYYAVLVLLSIVYLLHSIIDRKNSNNFEKLKIVFLIGTLVLLTSRTAIFTLLLIICLYVIKYIAQTKKYRVLLFPIMVIVGIYITFSVSRFGISRMDNMVKSMQTMDVHQIFPMRMQVYHSAIEAIRESPLVGYGIEGSQTILETKYLKYGYEHPLKYNYHAHNQYLQVALYGGVGLCFLLLVVLILPMFLSKNKLLWVSIFLGFGLPFVTDSPLTDIRVLITFILILTTPVVSFLGTKILRKTT